ncbi:MAG: hypothetical protein Ct9H90mP18_01940 [Gammaproteobacteria bacterium]|nr:MAG: hypothetical protein Ct9H90mP18_01940 [Gammaproteobacteria bacterium]
MLFIPFSFASDSALLMTKLCSIFQVGYMSEYWYRGAYQAIIMSFGVDYEGDMVYSVCGALTSVTQQVQVPVLKFDLYAG